MIRPIPNDCIGKDQMKNVTITPHGKFVVKAGHVSNQAVARLFAATPMTFRGPILEATGGSADDATAHVIDEFDSMAAIARSSRRLDSVTGAEVPTQFEFETALRLIDVGERAMGVLRKLPQAVAGQLNLADFARVANVNSAQELIDCLERLCSAICAEQECLIPTGMRHYIILRIPSGEFPRDNVLVELQPEFRDALSELQQGSPRYFRLNAA